MALPRSVTAEGSRPARHFFFGRGIEWRPREGVCAGRFPRPVTAGRGPSALHHAPLAPVPHAPLAALGERGITLGYRGTVIPRSFGGQFCKNDGEEAIFVFAWR